MKECTFSNLFFIPQTVHIKSGTQKGGIFFRSARIEIKWNVKMVLSFNKLQKKDAPFRKHP
jgi:hypothetical protein